MERDTVKGEHRRVEMKPTREFPSRDEIRSRIEAAEGTPDYDYWVDVEAEAERRDNHEINESLLHGVYYEGKDGYRYYHHGVAQPHSDEDRLEYFEV